MGKYDYMTIKQIIPNVIKEMQYQRKRVIKIYSVATEGVGY